MASKLEQLLKKQEELKAQIRKEKNKLSQAERKLDTRRKILLGALMMDMMNKGELDEKNILKRLDGFLSRNTDRQLFDLTLTKEPNKPIVKTDILSNSSVQVILEKVPKEKKISIIKIVREVTGLALKETKELVEAIPTLVIKVDLKKAEQIKKNLIEAGATVTLKK